MWFILIGVAMLVMNFAGIGPVGRWTWADHWWALLLPFLCAVVWWAWVDMSGLTQRRAMEKEKAKTLARRQKDLHALGLQDPKNRKR
ncbi:MAG: TIGR04438 family Trp-rich protein [Burkholderiales bacterium]|nr:TIGR04438 family Trp-rich protein [Burkholderiales bacterium]